MVADANVEILNSPVTAAALQPDSGFEAEGANEPEKRVGVHPQGFGGRNVIVVGLLQGFEDELLLHLPDPAVVFRARLCGR